MPKIMRKDTSESMLGANPYNKNKEWDEENKTGKEFVSADDSMAYASKPKTAVLDKMENKEPEPSATPEPEPDATQAPEPKPFQKVDYKKRYDDLKKHYDRKVNEFKGKEQELKEQIQSNRPKYEPPKSKEELEEFKKDNPDIFGVVETISHMQASQQLEELQEELKQVKESLQLEEAKRAYIELNTLVPDWEQIRQSDDFHNWAEQQPEEIQNWVYKNRTNVRLAAQAINLYKASTGQSEQKPPEQPTQDYREAAQAVTSRTRTEEPSSNERIWTNSEINALSLQQYEQVRDEIDRAFSEGRVVME